mgnify:CR=1 FL=1
MKKSLVVLGGGGLAASGNYDLVICADSGFDSFVNEGYDVDYLVGDMDSISKEDLETAREQGMEIVKYDPDKDMTDGELAVRLAVEKGSDDITIMGGREGRLDHILSSVDLLYLIPESRKARLYYLEDLVYLLREGEELEVDDPNKVYSVLPGDPRSIVSEIGFKWPLESELLEKGTTMGIHNELSDEKGIIRAEAGDIIVIICRDL